MRRKCILCLLLCLLLWAVAFPVSAAETSGTCGIDTGAGMDGNPTSEGGILLWNFDVATGTLTISGRGVMFFGGLGGIPWKDWQNQITRVVIEEGCYTIEKRAFSGCQNITSVTLPGTVRTINESAFNGCKELKEIQLPETLNSIYPYAFAGSGIRQIEIPPNVTYIGSHAFAACPSLEKITFLGLPPALTTGVFADTTTSVYHPENPSWTAVEGFNWGGELTWVAVPCPGHQLENLPAQEATCTQIGLTAGVRCSLCLVTMTPQEQVPMKAHDFGDWVETSAPSQWSNGSAARYCTVCDLTQTKAITTTTVLNPVIPPVTETPVTPPATEAPSSAAATETPADTEEPTVPTQVQTAPTEPTSAEPQGAAPEQDPPVFRWWVIMLIAGVVLLGGGLTAMILFRDGISVFKKK